MAAQDACCKDHELLVGLALFDMDAVIAFHHRTPCPPLVQWQHSALILATGQ